MNKYVLLVLFLLVSIKITFCQGLYLEKGNAYLNNAEFEKAEATFREGIEAEPENLVYQCQLALTLIEREKYEEAENVIEDILKVDSINIAAIWYSGIGHFYSKKYDQAIERFERTLLLFDIESPQYFSANWFIGKCYSVLLKTEGLTFKETDRMFECYEKYLKLQPDAQDAAEIKEYVERKKKRRPSENVKRWVDL